MTLRELTRESVLAALREHDDLGRQAFLSRYGFEPARTYVLVERDREYDSKAVAGAAHGFATGQALRAEDFSGGAATVGRRLTELGFKVEARVSPDWTQDEVILVCDAVAQNDWQQLAPGDPRVRELSDLLRRLPIHPASDRPSDFRNANGVVRKSADIATSRTGYSGKRTNGGETTLRVVQRFEDDTGTLHEIAQAIRQSLDAGEFNGSAPAVPLGLDDEAAAEEGALLAQRHLRRERNPALRRKKIEHATARGWDGSCEVCGFSFARVYGPRGLGYIECHHAVPLHVTGPRTTKLADLLLICSNCHRMIHRGSPWLSPDELRELVRSAQQSEHSNETRS